MMRVLWAMIVSAWFLSCAHTGRQQVCLLNQSQDAVREAYGDPMFAVSIDDFIMNESNREILSAAALEDPEAIHRLRWVEVYDVFRWSSSPLPAIPPGKKEVYVFYGDSGRVELVREVFLD